LDYRIYQRNGDASIQNAEWIECETDDEALMIARRFMTLCSSVDIWSGTRCVATLVVDRRQPGLFALDGAMPC
jgi:hypothetical protein